MRRALALALVISSAFPACARELLDHDPFVEPDMSGSVRIPLSASAPDGTTYVLRDAVVEIGGAAMLTLSAPASDSDELERAINTALPAGSYTLFLRPGYRVIEIAPNGTQRTVSAALHGQNPQRFALREVEDATLKLTFDHGDRKLVFGAAAPVRVTSR